jgi:hypothetical protein
MKNNIYILLLIFTCLLSACNEAGIDTEGFDLATWKDDKKGCTNKRLRLLADFEKKIKPKLEGLSEMQVANLLGKADFVLLAERNQKFYRYYIEEGEQCKKNTQARYINIRFNATNRVNEVTVIHHGLMQ